MLCLEVQDGDSPFTSAWRVKFNILNGNEEGHFDILTDPETNEGILNVIKVNASAGSCGCCSPFCRIPDNEIGANSGDDPCSDPHGQ